MGSKLWDSIAWILEGKEKDPPENILLEPDDNEGNEADEVSAGGVAGVSVPLGAGPHYPNEEPPGRQPSWVVSGKAFGGAKPSKGSRKKTRKICKFRL